MKKSFFVAMGSFLAIAVLLIGIANLLPIVSSMLPNIISGAVAYFDKYASMENIFLLYLLF